MSKKRPDLAEVATAAGSTRKAQAPDPEPTDPPPGEGRPPQPRPRTRPAGTRQIAGHFPEEVAWQLRELAVERRTTVQGLLAEALDNLFQKHGKPEIAARTAEVE